MNVLVWAEDRPSVDAEKKMRQLYPRGIQGRIEEILSENEDMNITTATMQDPEQGLPRELLNKTDVLVFWSHKSWRELEDCHVEDIRDRVLDGMGLIVLHSGHASKVFSRLMGTRTQTLRWRENDERQRYWIVAPAHPIVQGLPKDYFDIPMDETYGEYFGIPQPDELIFITNAEGGEVFRSGCCWQRGMGKIFYFQGGHETYPVYYQTEVEQILKNAVRWACMPNAIKC